MPGQKPKPLQPQTVDRLGKPKRKPSKIQRKEVAESEFPQILRNKYQFPK